MPETTLLGLQPGDVFVHRNIANVVASSDMSLSAVLEFAILYLKVAHVVLCGHTSCGGCAGALGDERLGGVLDTWLAPLKALRQQNEAELKTLEMGERTIRLAEMNVREGCKTIMGNWAVQEGIQQRGLKVHGVIYDIAEGKLRDLTCGNEEVACNDDKGKLVDSLDGTTDARLIRGQHGALRFSNDGKEANMVVR